jgi:hypothetical protein
MGYGRRMHVALTVATIAITGIACESRAAAQCTTGDNTSGIVGLGVSADYLGSRDLLISPRPWHGTGLSQNGFIVTLCSGSSMHEAGAWVGALDVAPDGRFSFLRGNARVSPESSQAELFDVSYSWLRRLSDRWWLGASAAARATHTRYEMGTGAAEGYLYWLGFQITGRRDFELGGGRSFSLSLRLPVFGWAARSPFSTVDEERLQSGNDIIHRIRKGEVFTPMNLLGLATRLTYLHPLGERFGVWSALRLGYVSYTDGPRYKEFRAGMDLGASIRWSGGGQ